MKIKKLIEILQSLPSEVTEVKCSIDEEWNAIGELECEIDGDTKELVIFPVSPEHWSSKEIDWDKTYTDVGPIIYKQ